MLTTLALVALAGASPSGSHADPGVACLPGTEPRPEASSVYPIAPVPLLDLCEQADFIGVVRVVSMSCEGGYSDVPEQGTVTVEECWFGDASQSSLPIVQTVTTVCPNPPRYPVGDRRLVFLEKYGEAYRSVGLSYGSKPAEHVDLYREAVRAWQDLPRDDTGRLDRLQSYLWTLRVLEQPRLRSEALYALTRDSFGGGGGPSSLSFRDLVVTTDPAYWRAQLDQVDGFDGSWTGGRCWRLWALADRAAAWLDQRLGALDSNASYGKLRRAGEFLNPATELATDFRVRNRINKQWEQLEDAVAPWREEPPLSADDFHRRVDSVREEFRSLAHAP